MLLSRCTQEIAWEHAHVSQGHHVKQLVLDRTAASQAAVQRRRTQTLALRVQVYCLVHIWCTGSCQVGACCSGTASCALQSTRDREVQQEMSAVSLAQQVH